MTYDFFALFKIDIKMCFLWVHMVDC